MLSEIQVVTLFLARQCTSIHEISYVLQKCLWSHKTFKCNIYLFLLPPTRGRNMRLKGQEEIWLPVHVYADLLSLGHSAWNLLVWIYALPEFSELPPTQSWREVLSGNINEKTCGPHTEISPPLNRPPKLY